MTAIKIIIHQHHRPHADDYHDDNNISSIILTIITIFCVIVFLFFYHFGKNDLILTKLIAQMHRCILQSCHQGRRRDGSRKKDKEHMTRWWVLELQVDSTFEKAR